jgi:hypothetical protein
MFFGFPKSSFGEHTFTPKFQPEFMVDSFDELSEMDILSKKGASLRLDVLVFLECHDLL